MMAFFDGKGQSCHMFSFIVPVQPISLVFKCFNQGIYQVEVMINDNIKVPWR